MQTPTRAQNRRVTLPDAAQHPKCAAEAFEKNGFAGMYTRSLSQRTWNAVGYGISQQRRRR